MYFEVVDVSLNEFNLILEKCDVEDNGFLIQSPKLMYEEKWT